VTCSWRFISAVAFATILAVVTGLVIVSSGAVAHDLWTNVVRRGEASEAEEVRVGRIAALGLGLVAIVISVLAGEGFNVSLLVGLAFAVAASSNLPALVFALFWKRFNTTRAVAGVLGGLLTSLVLIVLSPAVWPGPDGDGSPIPLTNPAIISIPAGVLCAVLGTLLSRERSTERSYHELHVRAETGLGAEQRAVVH
jgi:cation/acetate symporter